MSGLIRYESRSYGIGSIALWMAIASLSSSGRASYEVGFEESIEPFIGTYCIGCHGPDKQKGDRRFDTLEYPIANDDLLIDFQDMLDLLNLGEMPPEEEKQPSDGERLAVIDWLTNALDYAYETRTEEAGETVLRRLTRREYLNTVQEIFQIDTSMFDPTETFPSERTVEHLDNVGDALVTSGYLLNRYLDAADEIVEKALGPTERPEPRTWRFGPPFLQQSELDKRHMTAHGQSYLNVYENPNSELNFGAYGALLEFEEGVPVEGYYTIRALAEARNRFHEYDAKTVPMRPEEPLVMRIVPRNRRFGRLHLPQPYEPNLATFTLADDGPQWYETRSWLHKGFSPRFNYMNGAMKIRPIFTKTAQITHEKIDHTLPREDREMEKFAFSIKHAKIPHIRIYEVEIEGPFYDDWPTPSFQSVIGGSEFSPSETRRIIERFASRAFRRPARTDEVERIMDVVSSQIDRGKSELDALKAGLKAILISPAFIYLEEPTRSDADDRLDDYAVASRLSYFLWSGPPDDALLELAHKGRLHNANTRRAQVERMLDDERSTRFVSGFLDSWLTLRAIGEAPPDRNRFSHYYEHDLERAMRRETELFTRDLLDRNEKISRFLDADYSFVNEELAALYDIEGVRGDAFQKVSLNDPRRGGLLGQASILKITANGFDTSPVVRGVWLLENLLGTPPSPPPPDVEPLDPDIRGAQTIREQLQLHRENASC